MGKLEEGQGQGLPASAEESAGGECDWIGRILRPRCVVAVVLGFAVLLSAVFWLPPFLKRRGYGPEDADLEMGYGANILASFVLQRSVHDMNSNNQKLEYDIFDEIRIPNTSVIVTAVGPLPGLNWTLVVFGVLPYPPNSVIPSTSLSILRSYFVSMAIQHSILHLTQSLFGNSSFFQVLEFPGGITIIPPQNAFLLQKVQILFNFTLNFSIHQVQNKTGELRDQMGTGLHLASNECLYFRLTNLLGSTIAPPVIVQTAIVPVVGKPSESRLKQLAQTITGSRTSNLGLNHTVFGKVKQISLSSYLQQSLNGGKSSGTHWSPSPAPQPFPHYQLPQQQHYPPQIPQTHQTPPAPQYGSQPPPGCQYGFSRKFKSRSHFAPAVSPTSASDLDLSTVPAV